MKNSTCLPGVLETFVERGTSDGLGVSWVETMEPPPFRLEATESPTS